MDHAATTPIDGDVLRVMNYSMNHHYVNPGGLYQEGIDAKDSIYQSRKSVASLLGTTSDHIIFTRGGTESCNMAVMGVVQQVLTRSPDGAHPLHYRGEGQPHVIASEIEHSAVLETLKYLEKNNQIELSLIPVDEQGIVDVAEIKKALRPETVLVCVMYANNEIGTIQPIKEVSKLVRWYKKQQHQPQPQPLSLKERRAYPLLYVDAIQAVNYLDINVERLGVDLMSLSGSKIYGPKSIGVLYVRNREILAPMLYGGSQEFGLRAGTEDTAQIVGFTKALEKTRMVCESETKRLAELQKYFFELLEQKLSNYVVNGAKSVSITTPSASPPAGGIGTSPLARGRELRLPNNINISIQGVSSERLVIELDAQGIIVSSQSACRSDADEESYVISALRKSQQNPLLVEEGAGGGGTKPDSTQGSIRFTMGRGTTKRDVERTVQTLVKIVNKIRNFEKQLKN